MDIVKLHKQDLDIVNPHKTDLDIVKPHKTDLDIVKQEVVLFTIKAIRVERWASDKQRWCWVMPSYHLLEMYHPLWLVSQGGVK